jgi:NAD(P)-dependent dehydrogenase (short-subunit alcohol dehydrogenase family)
MYGKVCLVTGATSGIGKEIARGLARMGATVVVSGRSKEKCENTLGDIGRGSHIVADLSLMSSVRQLAQDFAAGHGRLDVLVNNTGVFLARRELTADGLEYTLAVNHLAPFLLTRLLTGLLRDSAPSRIITTSSVAHRGSRINFDDIQFTSSYSGIRAYRQSKLANILFTRELARRLEGTGVTANCFHPGAVRTNLVQGNPWFYRLVWAAIGPFMLSPEKGADTAVYLASSPEVEGMSGKYFVKRKVAESSEASHDMEAAGRLWALSEELVKKWA